MPTDKKIKFAILKLSVHNIVDLVGIHDKILRYPIACETITPSEKGSLIFLFCFS